MAEPLAYANAQMLLHQNCPGNGHDEIHMAHCQECEAFLREQDQMAMGLVSWPCAPYLLAHDYAALLAAAREVVQKYETYGWGDNTHPYLRDAIQDLAARVGES